MRTTMLSALTILTVVGSSMLAGCSAAADDAGGGEAASATTSSQLALRGEYDSKTPGSDITAMLFVDDTHVAIIWKDLGQRASTYVLSDDDKLLTLTDMKSKKVTKLTLRNLAKQAKTQTNLGTESLKLEDGSSLTQQPNTGLTNGSGGTPLVKPTDQPLAKQIDATDDQGKDTELLPNEQPLGCEGNPVPGGGTVCFYDDPMNDFGN